MESFSCKLISKSGIKVLEYLGNMMMRNTQNTLLAISLALSSVFAMNAQSNDNGDAKFFADNSLANTELVDNKRSIDPVVRHKMTPSEAQNLSRDEKIIMIDISGGQGTTEKREEFTAQEWATILQRAFGDKEFTNYPTDRVVSNWVESNEEGPTVVTVTINGHDYKTKDGTDTFTAEAVVQYVDVFTKKYADDMKLLAAKEKKELKTSSTNAVGYVYENN